MENPNPPHIDDLPDELLHEIFQHIAPSPPDSLNEALQVKPLSQTSQRWRAIALPKAPFTTVYPPWKMKITSSFVDLEYQKDEGRFPKLVLSIDGYKPPGPVHTLAQITEMSSSEFQPLQSALPPYQIAFEVAEDLEVQFGSSFRVLHVLHDTSVHSTLKSLEMKGAVHGGTLFIRLHTMTFPFLRRLIMDECLAYPEVFENILRRMPNLEECRINLYDHGWPCNQRFESSSLVSLAISFSSYPRDHSWKATASMPKLETLVCRATHPFRKALTFVSPSVRTIVTHVDEICADQHDQLMHVLEKSPQLERLVVPTNLLLMPVFFNKLSSGVIVPNLKELQCGASVLSADSLVRLLRKKGFVDAPASKSDGELPTPGVCAFSRVSFGGLLMSSRKEIEERLEGVTGVVEFVDHQMGTKKGENSFGI
ncbi:hypothetical protein BDN72DRAFT_840980 [Pluteus cervinus]|uniref:Uncharacterized protein n=1 Tax=Pluteus cervinus TaxID=181527 RepID=A0ACD3AU31_9AGAR|nr:hypothetical protein BDN72DRAFT_840980 [Pluteus cervinus]